MIQIRRFPRALCIGVRGHVRPDARHCAARGRAHGGYHPVFREASQPILRLAGDTLKLAVLEHGRRRSTDGVYALGRPCRRYRECNPDIFWCINCCEQALQRSVVYISLRGPSHALTFLSLDAIAGIKSLRFVVDGKLEDQGGVGFAPDPQKWRLDVAIRNDLNPSRVFLVQVGTVDSVDRQIVVETDIPRPTQPVSANTNYSIWSIALTDENSYFIGAEVDGVKFSGNDDYGAAALGPCAA
ncbi:hypothetical protein B0H14DRAFT_3143560 [Mycena olivaceomarginata]|nr:hypothetical protein B0H14DRAFT_3143560 [Mycena olivaceomarginata]